jgi:hypothetical protein
MTNKPIEDLPPHPWPEEAEKLYQESLQASMMSAVLLNSPSQYMREWGLAEWSRADFLGAQAIRLLRPPPVILVIPTS